MAIGEVVFGQEGDLETLGARTLEGLNLVVDPTRKKLVAGGPVQAAATGSVEVHEGRSKDWRSVDASAHGELRGGLGRLSATSRAGLDKGVLGSMIFL